MSLGHLRITVAGTASEFVHRTAPNSLLISQERFPSKTNNCRKAREIIEDEKHYLKIGFVSMISAICLE